MPFALLCQAFGFGAAIGSDACLSKCQSARLNDTPRKMPFETLESQQQKAKALVVTVFSPKSLSA